MRFNGTRLASVAIGVVSAAVAWAQNVPGENDKPDSGTLSKAIASLKATVNERNYGKVGFQSAGEAASATLGLPIRRYIVRPDKLAAFKPDSSPAAVIEDTRQWIYPVLVNGAVRCEITIAWRPGGWKAIAYGEQGFARSIFTTRRDQAATLRPPREDLFFVVDTLIANRKFVALRTDGQAPTTQPGDQTVYAWLGPAPDGHKNTEAAATVLSYLAQKSQSTKKGPG